MKAILVYLLIMPFLSSAQVASFGLEDWENISTFEKPIGWETTQDTLFDRILKSSDSSEGNFAMHFVAQSSSAFLMCDAYAWTSFKIENPSSKYLALTFDVKIIPEIDMTTPFFVANVEVYQNGTAIGNATWRPVDAILDYEKILLEIPYVEIDSMTITFGSGAIGSSVDDCYAKTEAWLDNIVVVEGITNTTFNVNNNVLKIAPNPISHFINIEGDIKRFSAYEIISTSGQLMQKGKMTDSQIDFNLTGIFFLRLLSENKVRQLKFVSF